MKTIDVKAKTGIYRGQLGEDGIARFYGVRYAKKPSRWKIAEPLVESDELIHALEPGDACPQPFAPFEWPKGPSPASEDCLWLNIWNTDDGKTDKPVLVWIHGGSFATGSARLEYQNGAYGNMNRIAMANPDIVFVSVNYRLNLIGSIDLRAFEGHEGYEDSNDLELRDMIAALRWVHENITYFSGNPDDVTVMGQSAGAWAVSALCVIPEAVQYFCKAILSSSSFSEVNEFNGMKTDAKAAWASEQLKEILGVSSVAALLAIPAEELGARAYEMLGRGINFEPLANGRLFPAHPSAVWKTGVSKHVTMLAGSVSGDLDTTIYGWSEEQTAKTILMMFGRGPDMGQKAIDAYLENDPQRDRMTAYKDALTDISLRGRLLNNVEQHLEAGGKAYVWYCDYMATNGILRTQHMFDVHNVFDGLDSGICMGDHIPEPVATFEPNKALQKQFQKAWMNFVRNGDPNCAEIGIEWKPYDCEHRWTAQINRTWKLLDGGVRPRDFEVALAMNRKEGIV